MSITVKLFRDKTTKNTVVFKAPKGEPVDTLYVQQAAFQNGEFPTEITIVIHTPPAKVQSVA